MACGTVRFYVIQNIIIAIREVPVPHSGMCDVRNAGSFDTNPPPYFDSGVQHNTHASHASQLRSYNYLLAHDPSHH